ncbi:hypothetical protein [Mycolicibacterium fortuitum]|uniref:hypothetical protein n=1 Tax=Mycolicibacterium fortuitum TaxID=1766 RepID=UPI00096D07C3|nr:hypothetical protein [Mycolicibacterium fortuitum]OMC02162.1 hypothetical protein A5734_14955 [Mycolicibacterium fortuitum]
MPSDGSTAQRGYGYQHKKLREQVKPLVDAGQAHCWRCLANGLSPDEARIKPGEPWDLGHDDDDRTKYRGPEHERCNRATAGRQATFNGPPVDTSRPW